MPSEITNMWNQTYNTNAKAKPIEHREVKNARVVRVNNAHLRGSDFSGVFELADVTDPFDFFDGKERAEVQVGWFGMKPKTTWSHITLGEGWELIENFSGKVVHNLGE
jgi:hypothetical protein